MTLNDESPKFSFSPLPIETEPVITQLLRCIFITIFILDTMTPTVLSPQPVQQKTILYRMRRLHKKSDFCGSPNNITKNVTNLSQSNSKSLISKNPMNGLIQVSKPNKYQKLPKNPSIAPAAKEKPKLRLSTAKLCKPLVHISKFCATENVTPQNEPEIIHPKTLINYTTTRRIKFNPRSFMQDKPLLIICLDVFFH